MRPLLTLVAFLSMRVALSAADPDYPLRDIKDGEALPPSWWCDSYYSAVVIVRGSLAAIEKDRPDLSITGSYATWSKLTHPSLASEPAEKGFYLLLTRFKAEEVIYVDLTLRQSHADIWALAHHTRTEFDCILPAGISQAHQQGKSARRRQKSVYRLDLPGSEPPVPNKEYVLIFKYTDIYPINGLHLSSFTEIDNLDQIRRIAAFRGKGWEPAQ
jgi:hypothetical protein